MKCYKDKDWLYEQYVEKKLTQQEMADKAGCGQRSISRWLRKHEIDTRSVEDYNQHPKPQFHPKGYIEFRDQSNGRNDRFYHHRLLAVAKYGIDAVKGKHVHHINGCGWDNRPANIEILEPGEHMSKERMKEINNGEQMEERFNE